MTGLNAEGSLAKKSGQNLAELGITLAISTRVVTSQSPVPHKLSGTYDS